MYIFRPYLKRVLWGGSNICRLKGINPSPAHIGESWEFSAIEGSESVVADGPEKGTTLRSLIERYGANLVGTRVYERYGKDFPLLVKFIDAESDLSVQVHPCDSVARSRHGCSGKTEMWYVLATRPGARIYCGLNTEIDSERYEQLVKDKRIMEVISSYESAPGDLFYIPSGRIHSIGGGNLLLEVQQASDITYRIYDFDRCDADGKPRELHTEMARNAIDYNVCADYRCTYDKTQQVTELIDCEFFTVSRVMVDGTESIALPKPEADCLIVVCVDGECTIEDSHGQAKLSAFHTALIPASATAPIVRGRATLIIAHP